MTLSHWALFPKMWPAISSSSLKIIGISSCKNQRQVSGLKLNAFWVKHFVFSYITFQQSANIQFITIFCALDGFGVSNFKRKGIDSLADTIQSHEFGNRHADADDDQSPQNFIHVDEEVKQNINEGTFVFIYLYINL